MSKRKNPQPDPALPAADPASDVGDVSLADAAFRGVVRTYGTLNRAMQPFFGRFGITSSQWGVLRTLHRAEQEGLAGLRMGDLGQRLVIRPPSVTTVVVRLEKQGLLVRTASRTDLRAKEVQLSPAGRKLVVEVMTARLSHVHSIMQVFTRQEKETLLSLLQRLSATLATSGAEQR